MFSCVVIYGIIKIDNKTKEFFLNLLSSFDNDILIKEDIFFVFCYWVKTKFR